MPGLPGDGNGRRALASEPGRATLAVVVTYAAPSPLLPDAWFRRASGSSRALLPLMGLLCALELSGWDVGAAPVTNSLVLRTNYYVVTGGTLAELYASILRGRPPKDGGSYDAKTEWNTSYTFNYQRTADGYAPTVFEVKTVVVMTLPLWQPPKERPPELATNWWPYARALTTHELGHVSLARTAAAEAGRRLRGLGAFPSAGALTQAAQQAFDAALDESHAQERRYDEETRHGATQGAVFPSVEPPPRPRAPSPPGGQSQK